MTETLEENRYCNGCRLALSTDHPSYTCTICPDANSIEPDYKKSYFLHEKCANLPYELQNPLHSIHPLYLYTELRPQDLADRFITCDGCRDICMGFIYVCEECSFKLDVKCALITAAAAADDDDDDAVSRRPKDYQTERVTELSHFIHPEHKLILANSSDPMNELACSICDVPILGPAYFCPNPNCTPQIIVHESCLGLPQKMRVPFLHDIEVYLIAPLTYGLSFGYSRCDACNLDISLFFNCRYISKGRLTTLHPICANSLKRPLEYYAAKYCRHNLYYFGTDCQLLFAKYAKIWPDLFCCRKCQRYCVGRPFYRCPICEINFHLECVPVPNAVTSRHHLHPLILKDSFVEDDSGEYYCDVCEEERCGKDHVYCCEQCDYRFVAHIECVLPAAKE